MVKPGTIMRFFDGDRFGIAPCHVDGYPGALWSLVDINAQENACVLMATADYSNLSRICDLLNELDKGDNNG